MRTSEENRQIIASILIPILIDRLRAVLPPKSWVTHAGEIPAFTAALDKLVKPASLRVMSPQFSISAGELVIDNLLPIIRRESLDAVVTEVARWVSGGQQVPCLAMVQMNLTVADGALTFFAWTDLAWSTAEPSPRREGSPQELDLCWTWVCPMCTTRNYHHGNFNAKKHDPTMVQEICEHLGVEDPSGLCCLPARVFCMKCEAQYPVKVNQ
jgi:hypothetical protein